MRPWWAGWAGWVLLLADEDDEAEEADEKSSAMPVAIDCPTAVGMVPCTLIDIVTLPTLLTT
jgi:hypothetical protein